MLDLDAIEARYTQQPIPPCCVCGAPLELGAISNGTGEWYCSAATGRLDDESSRHWWASKTMIIERSDPQVLALIAEVRRLRAALQFYADGNGPYESDWTTEYGARARAALGGEG